MSKTVFKFCVDNKIPFVFFNFSLGKNKKGEIVKFTKGIPNGWMKWNFEECMKYNKNINVNVLNEINYGNVISEIKARLMI